MDVRLLRLLGLGEGEVALLLRLCTSWRVLAGVKVAAEDVDVEDTRWSMSRDEGEGEAAGWYSDPALWRPPSSGLSEE